MPQRKTEQPVPAASGGPGLPPINVVRYAPHPDGIEVGFQLYKGVADAGYVPVVVPHDALKKLGVGDEPFGTSAAAAEKVKAEALSMARAEIDEKLAADVGSLHAHLGPIEP